MNVTLRRKQIRLPEPHVDLGQKQDLAVSTILWKIQNWSNAVTYYVNSIEVFSTAAFLFVWTVIMYVGLNLVFCLG